MTLDTFVPEPAVIEIDGEPVEITPLKIGELPVFIRAIRPFAQHLTQDVDWLALFGERGEDLVSALAVAVRKPPEWVAARELDEAIRLSEAVFEVNADFFIQRLAPILARVATRVETVVATAGARCSSVSSNTGTATPTS
ncbi:MAG: hypothetical protein Q8O33_05475 [Pseudomonadota bacterium]|nr:hypothetical protein [Pseudomonadota bacterium]